ncbi:MAG: PIG-L deacetylase family protein [Alkalispirochaeta sp.]
MDLTVLGVHSHPDDIEFVMAGTMFLLGQRGCELHYMNIANGCYGSAEYSKDEIIRIRRDESIAATKVLGATHHESIADDMGVFYTEEMIRRMAAVVREVQPDIVLTASPQDYMEDHMNACRIALGGTFVRAMSNYDSIPLQPTTEKDVTIYHAMPHGLVDGLRNRIVPDFFVNVGSVIDRKGEMLACHRSQKDWLDRTQGMGSYVDTMKEMTAQTGAISDVYRYAEGWRRHLHIGYSRTEQTPLEDVLGDLITKKRGN